MLLTANVQIGHAAVPGLSVCRVPSHLVIIGARVASPEGGFREGAVAIPSGAVHRVLGPDTRFWGVYLDPRRYRFADVERLARRWRSVCPQVDSADNLLEDAVRLSSPRCDDRLLELLDLLRADVPLHEAIGKVGLSASRATHLVTEQTGAPPSAWRRWLRVRRAVVAIAEGRSATEAAHWTNFADAAHLTRSLKATTGVTPRKLAAREVRIQGYPQGTGCR